MEANGLCVMITSLALGEERVRQALLLARFAADAGIRTTVFCCGEGVRLCDREYSGKLVRFREAFRKSGGVLWIHDGSVPENGLDWEDLIEHASVEDYNAVTELLTSGSRLVLV